jgi:hypothetical protein
MHIKLDRNSIPEPNSGCLLWIGAVTRGGHGVVGVSKGTKLAHRASWELHRGPIPAGMMICHKCDVPSCINPEHLFIGTAADNMADMMRKGRGRSELTPAQALLIYADKRSYSAIGAHFGVARSTVSCIKIRKRWRHLLSTDDAA